ncbi:MAG: sulfate transporter CysZ [Methylococcaceae bacterium]|nr:sulfate transporter CysZ [Methylococcaceae bacterium]
MSKKQKGNNPVYAVNCLLKGLKLIGHKQLRKFILIPLLINLVLYSAVFGFGYSYISDLIIQFIPDWLLWLEWLIWPIFFLSFSAIGFFTFTLLANLIAAPFYSQLSAKTVDIISGQTHTIENLPINQVIFSEAKRVLYLISGMLPLLILSLIPGINLIAPFLWLLFGAWGMGLEFMAYPMENKGLLFKEQKNIAKGRRIGVLCFGGLVVAGLAIPIFNLIVAPVAVIGATIYIHGVSLENK